MVPRLGQARGRAPLGTTTTGREARASTTTPRGSTPRPVITPPASRATELVSSTLRMSASSVRSRSGRHPAPRARRHRAITDVRAQSRLGLTRVEGVDLPPEVLLSELPSHLERRRQLAGLGGKRAGQDREAADLLGRPPARVDLV